MSLGHLRMALITLAKPLKKTLPVSKSSIEMSSSKLAPAQKARSPALFTRMSFTASFSPNSVMVLVNFARTLPGKELDSGWKNSTVANPRSSTTTCTPPWFTASFIGYSIWVLCSAEYSSALVQFLHHGQDGRHGNYLIGIVVDFHVVFHDALSHIILTALLLIDLFFYGQFYPDGCPWVNWLGESAFIDPVVQQHRTFLGLNKQSCRLAQDEISVRHSALEDGSLERSSIHMCVEVVAAHIGKVGLCNRVLCSVHRRTHFQLLKMLTEDMRHSLRARCSGLILLRNGCDIV